MSDPTVPPKAPPTPDAPVATDPPSPTEATDPAQTSPVGSTLNENYRVDRLIGAGGMGEVYEGEHLFTGNRVAIKMILQELSKDEGIVGLFRREARILFELADDAIVRYLDSFYHSGTDRYCLVMQFIDGIPLADRLEEDGPLPLGQVKALLRRLSLGLDKAHSLGVTHRDLSPDNVMLRDGQVEKAAIIDFGIATAEDKTEATLFGRFAGKYKFVAPEQLGLFKGVVGPWTDIYGLGLLIAAAARGTPLSMGGSFPEAVQAREVAPDLSDLPPRLQPLLQRMLQPDPKDRPASMAEVAAMLDDPSLLSRAPSADRTVIASPPGTRPKSSTTAEPTRLARPPGAPAPAPGLQTTAGLGQPLAGTNPGTDGPFRLTAPPDPGPPAATPKRNRWPIYAVLLLAMAGVGALGVSQRPDLLATWLGPTAPDTPEEGGLRPQSAGNDPATPGAVALEIPPPDPSTREGFLAAFGAERPCTYATRVTAGADVGRIATFAAGDSPLPGLATAYGDAFGVAPGLVERPVNAAQCPVLDLVRALQGRDAVAPTLVLDAAETRVGGTVLGRVSDLRGRGIWLALVTTEGQVFDLSAQLEAQADGSLLFAFAVAAGQVAEPQPQLVLAVASPTPLVSAATTVDGATIGTVLPRMLAEAIETGAAAQLAQFQLVP